MVEKIGKPQPARTARKVAAVSTEVKGAAPITVAAPILATSAPRQSASVVNPVVETITTQKAAISAAAIEGSKIMDETITQVQDTAKAFTADAGNKLQAMFGGASERAKGAYEKSVKMGEDFSAFQKGNVEAMVESGKLAAKAAESLGQEAADYARKSFESSTAAFKTFAGAKSPTELFKLQSDYMKSYFEAAVAESTKVTEAWLKLAGEVAQPISNRMAVAVEKVKTSAAI